MTTVRPGEPSVPAPLLAMIGFLTADQRRTLARCLHQQLNAPPGAEERRITELGFLSQLLNGVPQLPEQLPYFPRQEYGERRATEAPDAPAAAALVKKYGSWRRVCWAAWGVLPDGRKAIGSMASVQSFPGKPRPARYSIDECVQSVQACATAIGKIPSAGNYKDWQTSVKRRATDQGQSVRIAGSAAVLDRLAPDRVRGSGWRIVISRVFGNARAVGASPPPKERAGGRAGRAGADRS